MPLPPPKTGTGKTPFEVQKRHMRLKAECAITDQRVQDHIATLPTTRENWFAAQRVRDEETMATSNLQFYVDRRRRLLLEAEAKKEEE